jgi:hypothetical protein
MTHRFRRATALILAGGMVVSSGCAGVDRLDQEDLLDRPQPRPIR